MSTAGTKRDYYEVLGVSRTTSVEEIKKRYRKVALECHPDRNPGDNDAEERFKEASEAYRILSDESLRTRYDRFGHAGVSNNGGADSFNDFRSFAEDIFGDIFGSFFGGGGQGVRRGRDLRVAVEISLKEASTGIEKELKIKRPVPCSDCEGTGMRGARQPDTCPQCQGTGQMNFQQGFFSISRPCSRCGGGGSIISDPCGICHGEGHIAKEQVIAVKIPAGIDSGQRLKLRGEGEVVKGAQPGDLYVEVSVKPHELFHRQDTELICEVPLTFAQMALGTEIEVETLEGKEPLKVPSGTPSGKVFKIPGKGMLDMHSGRKGALHIRVYVHVPKELSAEERELLLRLAEIEGKPIGHESESFLDKVKGLFD